MGDAPAGLTVLSLALTAATAGWYVVVRADHSSLDTLAVDRLPGDRATGESGRELGWIVPTAALPPSPTPGELALWSDQRLCEAWRVSYSRLRRLQLVPQPATGIARVAGERATYLDEVERRNPEGFSAWMAAGVRAPGEVDDQ
ncbi:MAG: putative rane protein [Nocardioidaceae bacterium]|nr:putative rane protein [Nocardioidaceae bacterium]